MPSKDKIRLAIFASGSGSNARAILQHFETSGQIEVGLIVSNKRHAGVFQLCNEYDVHRLVVNRQLFYEDAAQVKKILSHEQIDYIILAGFLWLIPDYLIKTYPDKILNIHPSLLPKYGGKGMYGHLVHEAVFKAGEQESGMTIHLVNENYDEGNVLFQEKTNVSPCKAPEEIAAKVLQLEHKNYPIVIEKYILQRENRNS